MKCTGYHCAAMPRSPRPPDGVAGERTMAALARVAAGPSPGDPVSR